MLPRLARVVVIGTSTTPGNAPALAEIETAAKRLAIQLQYLDIRRTSDIEPVFQASAKARADSILVLASPSCSRTEPTSRPSPLAFGCQRCITGRIC